MGNGNMSNKGQTRAIDDIKKWLKGSGAKKTYLLAGRGGTGKTSVIATVLKEAGFGVDNVVFATPTNAATEVLKRSNESSMFNREENYGTVASLVSKKPVRDAENNIKRDKDGDIIFELTDDLGEFRSVAVGETVKVIVVDESSMLVKEDYDALKKYYPDKLIIFMGDVAQLPPIDKKNPSPESEVFIDHLNENYSELEEVMRQGKDSVVNTVNDIVYPSLREVINLRREGYKVEFGEVSEGKIYEVKEGNVVVSGSNLKDIIKDAVRVHDGLDSYLEGDATRFEDAIVKDLVEQQENAKVIMFNQQNHANNVSLTNKVRKRYLEGVNKGKVYENGKYSVGGTYATNYDGVLGMQVNDLIVTNEGINHIPEYIVDEGDRIIRKAYKGVEDPPALRIVKGTTGKVLKIGEVKPTFYEKIEMKNMKLVSEYVNAEKYGEHQIVTVELNDAKKSVVDFIVPVRAAPGKVQSTYLLTPDIAFGYVNNVHKAQGHTYSTAYVDYDNIHNNFKATWNGDAESFLKAMYVAVSRPRQKLVMKMSGESVYPKGLLDLNNIQKCQG
jgi:ATP-dependent exoDNAse (exonuclease V) alpha subunit